MIISTLVEGGGVCGDRERDRDPMKRKSSLSCQYPSIHAVW